MNIRTRLLYFVFASALLSTACKHEPETFPKENQNNNNNNPGNNTGSDIPCNPDSVYFEKDIMPILTSNCAMSGCHGNGSAQDGVDLTNYENIIRTGEVRQGDPDESELYEVLVEDDEDKRMPYGKAPLSSDQIFMIRKWIQQGAKKNRCNDCDTNAITYSNTIAPVLVKNCVGCHNDNTANGNVKLNSYANVKIVADNGRLVGAITHATGFIPMPKTTPDGQIKLPDCKINQIKTWVNAGAPNN